MTVPAEHRAYLRHKGYAPRCPSAFSADEKAVLDRYGHWLEALGTGRITPATPEQNHFLQVAQGEAEPVTLFERVWRKLCTLQDSIDPECSLAIPHAADPAPGAAADPEETGTQLEQLAELRRYADKIGQRLEAERQEVLQTVQAQLEAIEARYAQSLQEANQAVAEMEEEIKAKVLEGGQSVRGGRML
jgi:uncharacterized protein YifE (UPF0438 family)